MDGKIYSPEKGKFVSLKTKHGQKVLKNYNEHRVGGDKHQNCAYCKIVNPQTGKLVSTYGQTGGRVIRDYVEQEGGSKFVKFVQKGDSRWLYYNKYTGMFKDRREIKIKLNVWYKYVIGPTYIKINNILKADFKEKPTNNYHKKELRGYHIQYTMRHNYKLTNESKLLGDFLHDDSHRINTLDEYEITNEVEYEITNEAEHTSPVQYEYPAFKKINITLDNNTKMQETFSYFIRLKNPRILHYGNMVNIDGKTFNGSMSSSVSGGHGTTTLYTSRPDLKYELAVKSGNLKTNKKAINEINIHNLKLKNNAINEINIHNLKNNVIPYILHDDIIIMPFGIPLHKVPKDKILVENRKKIAYSIIYDIQQLYDKGLYYTDLKPGNVVMINISNGVFQFFLIDLGSISMEDELSDITPDYTSGINNPTASNKKKEVIYKTIQQFLIFLELSTFLEKFISFNDMATLLQNLN